MDAPTRNGIRCAKVEVSTNHLSRGGVTMKITTIGIDLAADLAVVQCRRLVQLLMGRISHWVGSNESITNCTQFSLCVTRK